MMTANSLIGATERPGKPRLILHVGVTGHRHDDLQGCDVNLIGNAAADCLARIREIAMRVHERNPDHEAFAPSPPVLRFFSRLATGADLIVAAEAAKQGFELFCVLPFARDVYANDIDPAWRASFDQLLGQATHVLELDGNARTATNRYESFYQSRRMVLRHSDVLIAVWDPDNRPLGIWNTARLVAEARHDDLLVVHIDPRAPAAAHLDVREQDAAIHSIGMAELEPRLSELLGPPSNEAASPSTWAWVVHGTETSQREKYGDFLREQQRTRTLGGLWLPFRNFVHRGTLRLPRCKVENFLTATQETWGGGWQASPLLPAATRERVDAVLLRPYAWADQLADYYANLTRSFIILNYALAVAAVFSALIGHAYGRLWIAGEFFFIALVIGNTLVANHRRWHERWIDYRVLAERIRLQRFLTPLGRITPHTRRPAHLSFGDIRSSWVPWYFRSLVRALALVAERFDPAYVEPARAVMVKLLAETANGQIDWHEANATRFRTIEERLHWAGLLLFALTGVACVAHWFEHHWAWLTFMTAGFPALGAACAAITVHLQLDRVAKQSRSMHDRLKQLLAYLQRQPAESRAVGMPLEEIAECMTSEVLDWRSLFKGSVPWAT